MLTRSTRESRMRSVVSWGPALIVLVAVVVATWLAPGLARRVGYAQAEARVLLAHRTLDDDDLLQRLSLATRAVADAVTPSVVHVEIRSGTSRFRTQGAAGAGWVFDDRGHVVTNAHVVKGARSIRVELWDGRVYDAQSVGTDPFTDIAVLKLPTVEGIVPALRATGEAPRPGDTVFAFGSPFGFKFSMNQGIISAMGRDPQGAVQTVGGFTNFIQTDAAVNPGHSGGPLVDARGRVIGMNVAIATGAENEGSIEGQSAGISFAIPLATIERVVAQLIDHGRVERGYLGISIPSANVDPVADRSLYNGHGVRIGGVGPGGPAESAGMRSGDVITHIDGHPVTGVGVLRSLISNRSPGETIALRVWRDGVEQEQRVTLRDFPAEAIASDGVQSELRRLGLFVGLREDDDGQPELRVLGVGEGSAAESAGFLVGQRIVAVGGEPTEDPEAWVRALADAGLLTGQPVRISVRTPAEVGEPSTVTLRLEP